MSLTISDPNPQIELNIRAEVSHVEPDLQACFEGAARPATDSAEPLRGILYNANSYYNHYYYHYYYYHYHIM